MAPQKQSPIDDEIDGLFQLPLPEFTEARNALAAKLKKAGRRDDAAAVKALQKPPASAWAINQLRWRHPDELADLLTAGDRFREAQRAQLAGKRADLRKTLEAWRQALNRMTKRSGEVLKRAGHQPTPDLTRRISTTLETIATYGSLPDAPAAGRLTADLEPPGFEALAALVPRGGPSDRSTVPPRVLPFAQKTRAGKARKTPPARSSDPEEAKRQREAEVAAQRAAARKALEAAQQGVREARRTAQQAEGALKKAAARAKVAEQAKASAEQQRDEAEKRFEKAASDATEATREARRVAREAEEAAQALSDAERDVERARNALEAASAEG